MLNKRGNQRVKSWVTAFLLITVTILSACATGKSGQSEKPINSDVTGQSEESEVQGEDKAEVQGEDKAEVQADGSDQADAGQGNSAALAGKLVTIVGDSISTYTGYIPEDYSKFYPEYGDLESVEDTWWMQVIQKNGMELCANASYSGGTVSGDSKEKQDGRAACSDKRIGDLTGVSDQNPDIIFVFTGANELLTNIPLGNYDGTSEVSEGVVDSFGEAYGLMLSKIQRTYPQAQVYCFTILEVSREDENGQGIPFQNELGFAAEDYNKIIRQIAKARNLPLIDLFQCGITAGNYKDYTIDGTHPNKEGAKLMGTYVNHYFRASE